MSDHPIQGLMKTAMEQITEMVNVNTIVGDAIETGDGDVIMPISRVNFGFAAGGSDFNTQKEEGEEAKNASVQLPFGGGSGGGVSITPIAFLVVGKQGVRVVPLDNQTHLVERLIDSAPQVVDRIQGLLQSFGADSAKNRTAGAGVSGSTFSAGPVPGSGSGSSTPGGYTGSGSSSGNSGSSGGYSGMGSSGSGFSNASEVQPFASADNSASVSSLTSVNPKPDLQ